jgi:hypothetical protein
MRRYVAAPVFQQGEDVFKFVAVTGCGDVAATIGTPPSRCRPRLSTGFDHLVDMVAGRP